MKSLKGPTTRAASKVAVKGIQKMQLDIPTDTRAANTNDYPDFYSVGLEDSMGTVILADKNNTIAPLAYFQGENNIDINEVLEDSVSTLSFIVQMLVEQNLDMEEESPTAKTRAVTNTIVERVEPKCKVWWHQDPPFNWYCYTDKGEQAAAGCVAIAGAQALTVLRPNEPIISSWDDVIAEDPEWSFYPFYITPTMNEIATLIHEIGVNVNMNYGVWESGALKSDLINYFKKKYGVVDYDCKRAIDVLKTQHGVIIIGGFTEKKKSGILFWRKTKYYGGHAFIADGYVKYGNIGTKRNDDPYYLHINYGWGNRYANEAYVLSGNKNYTEDAGNYTYNGKIYKYNITYATLTYPSERFW